jgi:dipeptidyl aminopeptidase/acylaminoacyl peptidase
VWPTNLIFEAGIDAVLAKGLPIDPARVGVTGGSYGGFMTTWLIGHSQRFAAAVSARRRLQPHHQSIV